MLLFILFAGFGSIRLFFVCNAFFYSLFCGYKFFPEVVKPLFFLILRVCAYNFSSVLWYINIFNHFLFFPHFKHISFFYTQVFIFIQEDTQVLSSIIQFPVFMQVCTYVTVSETHIHAHVSRLFTQTQTFITQNVQIRHLYTHTSILMFTRTHTHVNTVP